MKKVVCLVFVFLALALAVAPPADADGRVHFRGGVWIGPAWGAWDPWWWGPPYYPYYQQPPVVIREQPPAYVEPEPQTQEEYYWYFCPKTQTYYPYVKNCPGGWLKVVPSAPPDEEERW